MLILAHDPQSKRLVLSVGGKPMLFDTAVSRVRDEASRGR